MTVGTTIQAQEPPATMRAVRLHAYGGPEVLQLEAVPRPGPGPGEVLVDDGHAAVLLAYVGR